ncbi:hypothetical protein [Desulfosporosinus sp. BG]|uniref:hypothetical protein n=1 Tax=Desulfosporosinus sp. BG TaxID=1633135 RepID=UPI000839F09D|nr:hypothetical protein [Desulfosporosinus sp. BG]ODA41829.1 hypothetical protein DSBG_1321 [Desulfosporosinus sp. BG]
MRKIKKRKLLVLPVFFVALVVLVISVSDCSNNPKLGNSQWKNDQVHTQNQNNVLLNQDKSLEKGQDRMNYDSSSKLAAPFRPLTEKMLKISGFPIFLPAYLPSAEGWEWSLKLETKTNSFDIEIDKHGGVYSGTLSGNVGQPPESPLKNQLESENNRITSINLPNGIKGKEIFFPQYPHVDNSNAIIWESGNWSCCVTGEPVDGPFSTVDLAQQIVNALDKNDQILSGRPGKLYLFCAPAGPWTHIYWKVNNSTWYSLDWKGDPKEAIQVLSSMVYIGGRE